MMQTRLEGGAGGGEIRYAVGRCSLGSLLVARTDKGLCAVAFGDDRDGLLRGLRDRFPKAELADGGADLDPLLVRVVRLVDERDVRRAASFDLPLDPRGTVFQRRVWQALQGVPAGRTASYAEIARRIGRPEAARAVARACGANPLAVVIPCHRIVRKDGSRSGYRWGLERKHALLEREAATGSARRIGQGRRHSSNVPPKCGA